MREADGGQRVRAALQRQRDRCPREDGQLQQVSTRHRHGEPPARRAPEARRADLRKTLSRPAQGIHKVRLGDGDRHFCRDQRDGDIMRRHTFQLGKGRLSMRARTAVVTAGALTALGLTPMTAPVQGAVAPVGQGFTVTAGDLTFILKQIKIAERHATTLTAAEPVRHARRPRPEPDPGPADRLRPAHRRRLLQQPVPGPRDVRRRRPAVPAPDQPAFRDAEDSPAALRTRARRRRTRRRRAPSSTRSRARSAT